MTATTHPFAPEEIMALLDGELSADRVQSVSAHVERCPECSALATELRGLSRQINAWQVAGFPERLTQQITGGRLEKYVGTESLLSGEWKHRRSPSTRFAIGVASAVVGTLLLLAVSVPNLLRSRMASNEASAVGSLRTLNTAAVTYLGTYGHYPPSLKSFGPSANSKATEEAADLVDSFLAGGLKSGYRFTYLTALAESRNSRGGYTITADPVAPGTGGIRHFSTDETGIIRLGNGEILGGGSPEKVQEQASPVVGDPRTARLTAESAPMIARTAELRLVVLKFDDARQEMDRIRTQHKGYVAHLSASSEGDSARVLSASLRVPADQLDVCIAELKKLGRVTQELQASEEVTRQHQDLTARLRNSRNTEARLNDVLRQRDGKITDVLDVEKESARVRGEIEQLEAERQMLEHRVDFATIDLRLTEEYKAQLNPPAPSVATQLRNATINGFRNASENLLGIILFLAEFGPTLLLWFVILFVPTCMLWRRYRRAHALGSPLGV
jgi:hypothetical protein